MVDLDVPLPADEEMPPLEEFEDDAAAGGDLIYLYRSLLQACLDSALGDQGRSHFDPQDEALTHTLFCLQFRAAPGSDLGTFLWMGGAIYLQELDVYILFTAFKGHDVHCGQPPKE
jgi:hypothetical protein